VRAGEVHDLAGSEEVAKRAGRLLVDRAPRFSRNRRELAQQMVHDVTSVRRLPIPSEPDSTSSPAAASSSFAVIEPS